jgi:hypothetical protein
MSHDALMFEFREDDQARVAADTLSELGYEPRFHGGGRLHIHVRSEDLTSALEVVQCHGGQMVEQAPAEEIAITGESYGLDAIPIPAHTVNEDWQDHYGSADSGNGSEPEAFPADDAPYNRFDAT